jgi:hypothetical protein
MDEKTLRRIEDALGVYDRAHHNPAYPDGRDPISRDVSVLVEEVRRLRGLLLEYGRHGEGCNAQWGDTYRCRCGWRETYREFIAPADQTGTSVGSHNGA